MLTFFRRIRKRLLDASQARKYVLYAIGEIALIVIGILIALQINNWNIKRLTQEEATNYRQKLLLDLTLDTANLNTHIAEAYYFQQFIKDYFSFFEETELPLPLIIDSARIVSTPYRIGRYFPINFTFLEMQSSGKLGLLSENQRRKLMELANFQDFVKIVFNSQIEDAQRASDEAQEYWGSNFSSIDFNEKFGIKTNVQTLSQGLRHKHNHLYRMYDLYRNVIQRSEQIKTLTGETIRFLQETNEDN